jgi:hypothetical protein
MVVFALLILILGLTADCLREIRKEQLETRSECEKIKQMFQEFNNLK